MNTLRNELKEKYSQIPNELITDLSLSHGSLRVLLYLFTKPDKWNVYNKDICKQLGISEQTLTKYWKELLSSKWLKREKRPPTDKNLAGGYIYQIGIFTISIESTEKVKSIEHSNNKPIKKQVTIKKLPRVKPKDFIYEDDFMKLWSILRNGDKWAGYKSFINRIKEGYNIETIENVLIKETKKKIGIRHFSTVLNGDIDIDIKQSDSKMEGLLYTGDIYA